MNEMEQRNSLLENLFNRRVFLSSTSVIVVTMVGRAGRRHVVAQAESTPGASSVAGAYAEVNGLEFYYVDAGDPNAETVLFLHGGLGSSDDWSLVWPIVAGAGYRVILLDSRKHGRSGWNEVPLTYEQFADDVAGLIEVLGIPRVDLVGWSDGAITALQFAMSYPDKLKRAVVYGANISPDGFVFPEESETLEQYIAGAAESFAALSPAPERFGDLYLELKALYESAPNFSETQLQAITAPVLVIDGANEELIAPDQPVRIAESIPGAELVILEGTGHFAPFELPSVFAETVLDFLQGDLASTPVAWRAR